MLGQNKAQLATEFAAQLGTNIVFANTRRTTQLSALLGVDTGATVTKTGFVTMKSQGGRELKAQELPGLWNGAMANWNTLFVEVSIETFNPVKIVNDLLRPQHQ